MGACIARCLPLYSDPRYQPVRSRYLIQDDVVQTEPSRASRLSASSDESLCMNDLLAEPSNPELLPAVDDDDSDDDPPILLLTPGLAQSPVIFTPVDLPPCTTGSPPDTAHLVDLASSITSVHSDHPTHSTTTTSTNTTTTSTTTAATSTLQEAEDEVELTQRIEQPQDTSPQHLTPAARSGSGYGGAASVGGERWWGSALPGSLPSLAGGDSPPTNSLDLEWEPEAGLGRVSRESLGTGEEEASQTAESSSWVPRSACSTPNSLEWDFRASTLSLRGQGDEETWQTSDQETEQLLYEIEQLAARALADTGHGLQPPR
ncbi:uncharacterized protein LOC123517962 isoform X2 [Portunus trituberculatus]|uniref:uncharacterized protein LOC123517962 isoform X2 n=1 Tax=Portunus trituberculatus TaxID=210409 RepID=UPI001E1D0CD9|nr:uncharacterized protein LOC123517962 isoform X2 [Portunus trituberculatus]